MVRPQCWRRGGECRIDDGYGDEDACDSLEGTHFYEMCMIRRLGEVSEKRKRILRLERREEAMISLASLQGKGEGKGTRTIQYLRT